jgi:hypothetical protein
MMIETRCPSCKARVRWDVAPAATEIHTHKCQRGKDAGVRWVVKVHPGRAGKVKGQEAIFTVVEWSPVVGSAP